MASVRADARGVPPLPVVSAQGVRLTLADGRELIDGMASWWCAIHGYRHPVLDAAVREQLDRMAHVMFGGLTHEGGDPARGAADGLDRASTTCSSRTPAPCRVEVAIKMVLQYWHGERRTAAHLARRLPRRHVRRDGGLRPGRRDARDVDGHARRARLRAAPPRLGRRSGRHEVRRAVRAHAHELAGVIVEPVVQGAGGMRFHPPECVQLLRELCDEHGLLLVLDEIATGFGRTGDAVRRRRELRRTSCASARRSPAAT